MVITVNTKLRSDFYLSGAKYGDLAIPVDIIIVYSFIDVVITMKYLHVVSVTIIQLTGACLFSKG